MEHFLGLLRGSQHAEQHWKQLGSELTVERREGLFRTPGHLADQLLQHPFKVTSAGAFWMPALLLFGSPSTDPPGDQVGR